MHCITLVLDVSKLIQLDTTVCCSKLLAMNKSCFQCDVIMYNYDFMISSFRDSDSLIRNNIFKKIGLSDVSALNKEPMELIE